MSLATAWQSLRDRADVPYADFMRAVDGAEVHDVLVDGEDVGAIVVIGPEIHACINPDGFGRWMNKAALGILGEVIAKHGYATTTVTQGNMIGDAFVTRLGFVRVSDSPVWKYRKEV